MNVLILEQLSSRAKKPTQRRRHLDRRRYHDPNLAADSLGRAYVESMRRGTRPDPQPCDRSAAESDSGAAHNDRRAADGNR